MRRRQSKVGRIKADIMDWLTRNTAVSRGEIISQADQNYLAKGWIDSFKFISLIGLLEEKYKITYSGGDLRQVEFTTVNGLARITHERLLEKERTGCR